MQHVSSPCPCHLLPLLIPFPCSRPSGGVVTWQSVEVWVIGGGTRRGGVVSVWCGMVSGPKQRVVWVPSS